MNKYDPTTAAELFPAAGWAKATASNPEDACVEVNMAKAGDGFVGLRDSKQPGAATFAFTTQEWGAFLDGVGKGEFDLPAA